MLKWIASAFLLAASLFSQTIDPALGGDTLSVREQSLAKAVEKQELRHYEIHKFYIPVTQGNLQWLSATVGAKPDEAIMVWKLMRTYDSAKWLRAPLSAPPRNPS
jgi:hypothetical protein